MWDDGLAVQLITKSKFLCGLRASYTLLPLELAFVLPSRTKIRVSFGFPQIAVALVCVHIVVWFQSVIWPGFKVICLG